MDYAEFMRRRGIPYPSPTGGDETRGASAEAMITPETSEESQGAETETSSDAGELSPGDEALTDAVTDTEPTGNRNRRRSTG